MRLHLEGPEYTARVEYKNVADVFAFESEVLWDSYTRVRTVRNRFFTHQLQYYKV